MGRPSKAQLQAAAQAELANQDGEEPGTTQTPPSSADGTADVREVTANGATPVEGEQQSEAANPPIAEQPVSFDLPSKEKEPEPETPEETGDVVKMGGTVEALVIGSRFVVFKDGILYKAVHGDRIKATRADVDRGVAIGYLQE